MISLCGGQAGHLGLQEGKKRENSITAHFEQTQEPFDVERLHLLGYHCFPDTLAARFDSIDTQNVLVFINRLMIREEKS